ncbi:uncharacterized protein LOC134669846 [Cydia fagiglandana]|uniref:uncharacterized protein LOC134669846 n=1 Tax=Cydia fagiglandana TaxID=1458189 RepID=UPI002FEE32EA
MLESALKRFSCDFIRLRLPWTLINLFLCEYTWCAQRTLICCLDWLFATMVRNSAMCCVPNCGKTRLDNVILHKFPCPINEADRFRTWIYSVGGDVLSLDNQFIHKYRKVCHIHFEEKFITRSGRLSAIAVPTLHLKGMATQTASVQIASNFQQPLQDDHGPRAPLINITNQYNAGGDDTSRPSTSGMATQTASLKIASILQEPLQDDHVPRAPLTNITNAAAHDASRPSTSGMATQTASLKIASILQEPLQDDHVPRAPLTNITNAAAHDASRPSTSGMATQTASLKIASILQEPLQDDHVPRAPLTNITNAAAHDASRPSTSVATLVPSGVKYR